VDQFSSIVRVNILRNKLPFIIWDAHPSDFLPFLVHRRVPDVGSDEPVNIVGYAELTPAYAQGTAVAPCGVCSSAA
jgi:hypothetical protein